MEILFEVNQTEAIRRGLNAPQSSVRIDIDPAKLTEGQRDVLAQLADKNLDTRGAGARRRLPTGEQAVVGPIRLVEPTLEAAVEEIAKLDAMLDEHIKNAADEQARDEAKALQELDEYMANPPVIQEYVSFDVDGNEVRREHNTFIGMGVEVPGRLPFIRPTVANSPPIDERIRQVEAWRQDQRNRSIASQRDYIMANIEAAKVEQAEWESYYARLPQTLRERYEAGFADEDREIRPAVARLIAAGHALPGWGLLEDVVADDYGTLDPVTLTDSQFVALTKAREQTGIDDLKPEVYSRYRRASEDDEPEDIDSDGEVYQRLGVFVSYNIEKAGLTIRLVHRLPDE